MRRGGFAAHALVALVALVAPVACGGATVVTEVPPQDIPPSPQPTVQAVVEAPMRGGEEWTGTYMCAQGQTDLVLHIDRVDAGQVQAVFEFSHSPTGAAGAYQVQGTLDPNGSVHLVPGPWLNRPPNYVSVGMTGTVRGTAFSGRMDNDSCGAFALHRR